jgi:hypothetical protein
VEGDQETKQAKKQHRIITYPTSGDPYQFEPSINRLKRAEVRKVISSLNPKK